MQGVNGNRPRRETIAVREAEELILFADGFEAAFPAMAARARCVARELLWLADLVAAERSARVSVQAQRDEALALLLDRQEVTV